MIRRQSIVLLVATLLVAASAYADGPGLTDLIQQSSWIVPGSLTNRTLLHEEKNFGTSKFYQFEIQVDQVLKSPTNAAHAPSNLTVIAINHQHVPSEQQDPAVGTTGIWFLATSKPHLKFPLTFWWHHSPQFMKNDLRGIIDFAEKNPKQDVWSKDIINECGRLLKLLTKPSTPTK